MPARVRNDGICYDAEQKRAVTEPIAERPSQNEIAMLEWSDSEECLSPEILRSGMATERLKDLSALAAFKR
jgi:hypothetical protein